MKQIICILILLLVPMIASGNPCLADVTGCSMSEMTLGNWMNRSGSAVSGSANQFYLSVQGATPNTSSPASYEKGALFASAVSYDESTPDIMRGTVGADIRATAAVNHGQVWGLYTQAESINRSNAMLVGLEVDVVNNASIPQPYIQTMTSTYGIQVVSGSPGTQATTNNTAAIFITNATSRFYTGLKIIEPAIISNAIDYAGRFWIDYNGVIKSSTPSGVHNDLAIRASDANRTVSISLYNGYTPTWQISSRGTFDEPANRLDIYNAIGQQVVTVYQNGTIALGSLKGAGNCVIYADADGNIKRNLNDCW